MSSSETLIAHPVQSMFAGAHRGATVGGQLELLDDLGATAVALTKGKGYQASMFADAGLDKAPPSGPAVVCLRGLLVGAKFPLDRPRLRRDAYRATLPASRDEAVALVAITLAVLAADLTRGFALDECLIRANQTLLEEAPLAILDALRPLPDELEIPLAADAPGALHAAVTALSRADSLDAALAALPQGGSLSLVMAGALSVLATPLATSGLPDPLDRVALDLDALAERA